jgi:putative SOS response-associated peptidase YedK
MGEGDPVYSCTILTTQANSLLGEIHERMPFILTESARNTWLDPDADLNRLSSVTIPCEASEMVGYFVSPVVNNVRNEGPECVEPYSLPEVEKTFGLSLDLMERLGSQEPVMV